MLEAGSRQCQFGLSGVPDVNLALEMQGNAQHLIVSLWKSHVIVCDEEWREEAVFDSAVRDVAIGVMFIFLWFSILCTAIREGIEGWLKTPCRVSRLWNPRPVKRLIWSGTRKGISYGLGRLFSE